MEYKTESKSQNQGAKITLPPAGQVSLREKSLPVSQFTG